ncbi:MAG: ArsC/Spx/MgsR family protein [Bacteroidota bacterium]
MTKKIYHLGNCSTCQRIIQELALGEEFTFQEIKSEPITPEQLAEMQARTGSYAALFSRRARKYRARGLHEQTLGEDDYRDLILEEYTFLNRPVLLIGEEIFVGSSKKVVAAAAKALETAQ